jgi:hypothetical protein
VSPAVAQYLHESGTKAGWSPLSVAATTRPDVGSTRARDQQRPANDSRNGHGKVVLAAVPRSFGSGSVRSPAEIPDSEGTPIVGTT